MTRLLYILLFTTSAAADTRTFDFDPEPNNAHVIDVDAMQLRDCVLDRQHGGLCVVRWDDERAETARIGVTDGAMHRMSRSRFEILERVLDSVEELD